MTYIEKAEKLFKEKFHCSQAVLGAFAQELGLTDEQALKLGGCFGGGMCKGEVCGACTGALMILGLRYGQYRVEDIESRVNTNKITVEFLERFKDENGSYICKELLGCDLSTPQGHSYAVENNLFTQLCPKLVRSATEIVEKML